MIVMHQHGLSWPDRHPFTLTWVVAITYWLMVVTAGGGGWPL